MNVGIANNPPIQNVLQAHEAVLLGAGEERLTIIQDKRSPNCCIFIFRKEDHTLGGLLRERLLKSEGVLFAGYRVPDPLLPSVELRVQTDGSVTPPEAVREACEEMVQVLAELATEFTAALVTFQLAPPAPPAQAALPAQPAQPAQPPPDTLPQQAHSVPDDAPTATSMVTPSSENGYAVGVADGGEE